MKRILIAATIAILSMTVCFATSCTSKKETTEQGRLSPEQSEAEAKKLIVAKVNGAPITMSELLKYMKALAAAYANSGQELTPEADEKIRSAALNELIFEQLALEEAARQGITVKPGDVDNELRKIKDRLGSDAAYRSYLDAYGLTEEDFRKQIENKLRYDAIAAKEIGQKLENVKTDDKTLKSIYEKDKSHFAIPEQITVEDLYFTSGVIDKQTMKKAKQILAELKNNGNDMTKIPQDGSFIVRQISVTKETLPAIYASVSGGLGGMVTEKDGLHIVKLLKKEAARQMGFAEAKPLIQQEIVQQAAAKRKKAWYDELRKNAKIEIIPTSVTETQNPTG